ncbi:MAG: tRNA 2-thiocytidine(32) synthetase TtcA [Ruminococcus sp.]|nr:tRNA 2-thiocytidine(32) synthetase TtcA [Ruminococcus sp.]
MQKILGYMRKAIQEYDLIENGDRIAVGVSGGKDSVILLLGLLRLKRFIGIDYDIVAITLDPQFSGIPTDYSPIEKLCEENGIEYHIERTNIGTVVFDIKKESHPCSLCAKMRRGALHDLTKRYGCNKIALGHHNDDVIETFLMNLFIEGRIGCFAPKSYLSIKDITMIRPLVLAPEKEIKKAAARNNIPIVKSSCPVDGHTKREEFKTMIREKNREDKGFSDRIFGALQRSGIDGWGFESENVNKL